MEEKRFSISKNFNTVNEKEGGIKPIKKSLPLVYKNKILQLFIEVNNLIDKEVKYLFHTVDENIKQHYRRYTLLSRQVSLDKHKSWLQKTWQQYHQNFALFSDIDPKNIRPRLELVENQHQRNIFRVARLYWSLPYTYGYGRCLNYLIWDDNNYKLIGILGLQSPPISLPARDKNIKFLMNRKLN